MTRQNVPVDQLVRVRTGSCEIRTADNGGMPTLFGHFTPFDQWSQIDSWVEGNFMERTVKGAFAKTIRENRDQVKVTFNHGTGAQGDLVLGPIDVLREEPAGPYYEVPLLDTSYNRDLLPGLKAGVYGASYRFRVIKDKWDDEPGRSDHNPDGLPERTISEVRLYEFGPVTYPAFDGATAAVRSMTDSYMEQRLLDRIDDQGDKTVRTRPTTRRRHRSTQAERRRIAAKMGAGRDAIEGRLAGGRKARTRATLAQLRTPAAVAAREERRSARAAERAQASEGNLTAFRLANAPAVLVDEPACVQNARRFDREREQLRRARLTREQRATEDWKSRKNHRRLSRR